MLSLGTPTLNLQVCELGCFEHLPSSLSCVGPMCTLSEGQRSIEMDAKVHWCCCVDQPGLIPDNVKFALSIPVPQMEGTHLRLRWIGTQLVMLLVGC